MDDFLRSIVRDRKPIYCAAPLFSPLERIAGANLAGMVETYLRKSCGDSDLDAQDCIFLPYRDTQQHEITTPNRARQVYELDIETLRRSAALLARLDGLAKDSGVAMEIGFAFGVGIPIGVLVTSFMGEGLTSSQTEWMVDPVIYHMADLCVCSTLTYPVATSYYQSNLIHESEAVREFVKTAFATFPAKLTGLRETPKRAEVRAVYVDVMGGRYEWSRQEQEKIRVSCAGLGHTIALAERHSGSHRADKPTVRDDIHSVLSAKVGVFSGDAPEMDPGSAALFGLCKSIGIPTIFQYSSAIVYKGAGGQQMKVNLMIEQAADIITSSTEETIAVIHQLLRE